ncbi:MAG: ferritin [Candidatus Firestonebacteria bacterium]
MDKKLVSAINGQINAELYSSYLYRAMAEDFKYKNWDSIARWLDIQAAEEKTHADKFISFLNDTGEKVEFKELAAPPTAWKSALECFEQVLKHEKKITALINALDDLAAKVNDKPAQIMLQWFINEQVEEEKNSAYIVEKLKIVKPDTGGFFMFDKQLGKRGESK